MCGICGFFGSDKRLTQSTLERMNRTLIRRGPDEGGQYVVPGAGIAMRRLSIIDLAGGRQPIHNEDATVWVVFNGEIYNYRQLRDDLQARGHRFSTHSDTEVIVHLYEEYGDDLVLHLRGMFAFALWDTVKRRGLIARDRLGIKPLFYTRVGDGLVFGSEIKAVLGSGLVAKNIDRQALDAYFAYTYIPAPLTVYTDIRKLEPGHLLTIEAGRVEQRQYWDVDFGQVDTGHDETAWADLFEKAIDDAVTSHLVSDVPLGAFLSGGIDSGMVVALMSRHSAEPVQTVTMGFGGSKNPLVDERPLAASVAARYGCQSHQYTVEPDFRAIVGEIVDAFDEPFADDSVIPSYYVSELMRRRAKVALSGLGGDELFAGYQRYAGVQLNERYSRWVPGLLHRHVLDPLVQRLREPASASDKINHLKRFSAGVLKSPAERYCSYVSTLTAQGRGRLFRAEVTATIDHAATDHLIIDPYERCKAPDAVSRALYADMKTYLPEDILALSDRLSMWHSLEVRVPLVDHPLVELSARLPTQFKISGQRKKLLLRRIASAHLPEAVMKHRKQGFEAPMGAWLRTNLADYARAILSPERVRASGFFNEEFVTGKLEEHLSGQQKNNKLLFSLIMFQEWFERHIAA
jgi:asparagine synthase (glutamine-hydrolysing)